MKSVIVNVEQTNQSLFSSWPPVFLPIAFKYEKLSYYRRNWMCYWTETYRIYRLLHGKKVFLIWNFTVLNLNTVYIDNFLVVL